MKFEEEVDKALEAMQTECPKCGRMFTVITGETPACSCGWSKDQLLEPGTNLQFGQRYSELARMIPNKSFPGINAGGFGDRG